MFDSAGSTSARGVKSAPAEIGRPQSSWAYCRAHSRSQRRSGLVLVTNSRVGSKAEQHEIGHAPAARRNARGVGGCRTRRCRSEALSGCLQGARRSWRLRRDFEATFLAASERTAPLIVEAVRARQSAQCRAGLVGREPRRGEASGAPAARPRERRHRVVQVGCRECLDGRQRSIQARLRRRRWQKPLALLYPSTVSRQCLETLRDGDRHCLVVPLFLRGTTRR
jgi:hypothetical protein